MLALRRFVAGIGALRDLCAALAQYSATQAVFVEPTDLWRAAWAMRKQGISDREAEDFAKHLHHAISVLDLRRIADLLKAAQYPFVNDPDYDFGWYPGTLKGILNTDFPLSIQIHVCRRNLPPTQFTDQVREIYRQSAVFSKLFSFSVEERPMAILAAQPQTVIHAPNTGTHGGCLKDPRATTYGVTCAHVAPSGATVYDGAGKHLGSVLFASMLNPTSTGQLCNLHSAHVNSMDASLFACQAIPLPSSKWTGPSTAYGSGQIASMTGGQSGGPNKYFIDGLGLIQTIHYAGDDYCFKDLFRITPRLSHWVPPIIGLAVSPSPTQGDSGAWISTNEQNPKWIGMLIGTDLFDGFAVDASDFLAWANRATKSSLSIA